MARSFFIYGNCMIRSFGQPGLVMAIPKHYNDDNILPNFSAPASNFKQKQAKSNVHVFVARLLIKFSVHRF